MAKIISLFDEPVKIKILKSGKKIKERDSTFTLVDKNNATFFDKSKNYSEKEIIELLDKSNVKGTSLVKKYITETKTSTGTLKRNYYTYWMCGEDENGNILNNPDDYLIAPCPPYCGAGG